MQMEIIEAGIITELIFICCAVYWFIDYGDRPHLDSGKQKAIHLGTILAGRMLFSITETAPKSLALIRLTAGDLVGTEMQIRPDFSQTHSSLP